MEAIKLPMTDAQMRKLAKGQGVRINPSADCTAYDVWCSPQKCKRMNRLMTKGKGFALKLDPEEMDENVEVKGGSINWKKIGKTLRSTAKSVGKFYREKLRPVVGPEIRKTLTTAIEKGIPLAADALAVMTGQPEILAATQPAVKKLAQKAAKLGTDKIGKLTGAFGMAPKANMAEKMADLRAMKKTQKGGAVKKAPARRPKAPAVMKRMVAEPAPIPYRAQLQDNYSQFLNPNHPAMNPTLPMPDNSLPLMGRGLYMDAGYGLFAATAGGRLMSGSPMDPVLPQMDNSTYY